MPTGDFPRNRPNHRWEDCNKVKHGCLGWVEPERDSATIVL